MEFKVFKLCKNCMLNFKLSQETSMYNSGSLERGE